MATIAPEKPQFRTSPTAIEALEEYFKHNPLPGDSHTDPFDVSRSDIYVEDRWQPIFAEMRAKGPIHFVKDSPFGSYWNVVQHKAIQHVESLPELFSSSWEHGGITISDPDWEEELAEGEDRFQLPMFIAMDRPKHTGQRRTVAPAFTPAEMRRMDDSIRQRTGELLDTLPEGEVFDWVDKVSIPLTTGMLAILFDFPWEDRELLTFWSDWAGDTELSLARELDTQRREILHEMAAYFQGLWAKKAQEEPGPDLISMMIHSHRDEPNGPDGVYGQFGSAYRWRQ